MLLTSIWLASRAGGRAQGMWLAFAAGISSAVASSFTETVLATGRWRQAMPTLGALAVFIVLGMLLSQLSYRRSLSAPLATATITNPVAAAVLVCWFSASRQPPVRPSATPHHRKPAVIMRPA